MHLEFSVTHSKSCEHLSFSSNESTGDELGSSRFEEITETRGKYFTGTGYAAVVPRIRVMLQSAGAKSCHAVAVPDVTVPMRLTDLTET